MSDSIFDDFAGADKVGEIAASDYSDALSDGTEAAWFETGAFDLINVSPSPLGLSYGTMGADFLYDFYYRIWIIPIRMHVRNARLGVDIPFHIWNAFPYPNQLDAIGEVDTTGLTLDVSALAIFKEIEYRLVNLQINDSAPFNIDAFFTFTFADGEGVFNFLADRLALLSVIPNVPVKETWEWLTDIITTEDGNEQRIALRNVPRRTMLTNLTTQSIDEVRAQIDLHMFTLGGHALIPYYQYATFLTVGAVIGATTLDVNTTKTDVRDGEFALLRTRDGVEQLIELDEVFDPVGVTLATPLSIDAAAGTWFVPVWQSLVLDGHSMRRYSIDEVSETSLPSQCTQVRESFVRPGSTTSFPNAGSGLIILDKRPMANQMPEDQYHSGTTITDQDTGIRDIYTSWLHTHVLSARQYLIKRNGTDFDFWRDFLDYVKGRRDCFLTPTYREDFYVSTAPLAGSGQLTLSGDRYSTLYFTLASHKYLRLWTAAGTHDCLVTSALPDIDGNDVITFTLALPIGAGWTDISYVSLLTKVRIGSDQIELDHYAQDTVLGLTLRTVDE